VKEAHKTLADLVGVEVVKWTANVASDGSIRDYKANVKVAFKVKGSD
jgi:flavin-binding protein dodecin